jgi:hypothetical protein
MAEALLPIGTVKGTIDTRLAPPDLVEGTYDDKTKECTGAKLVGPWTEKTDTGIGSVVSLYSELATESGTQVNGHKKSRELRDRGGLVQTTRESAKRSHAQVNETSKQIEQTIKRDLEQLSIWGEPDPSNYQNMYNQVGPRGRGSKLTQARMACSFKNLSLAKEDEREEKKLEDEMTKLKRQEKKLERQIRRKQNSLRTEETQ